MNKGSTRFLKVIIILMAAGALALLIRFPQTEGRATNLDLIQIYTDPLILYIYLASVPFFVALGQGYKLLGLVEKNHIFSRAAVAAVSRIKRCALLIATLILGSELYLFVVERPKSDDITGGVMMGLLVLLITTAVATAAGILQRLLLNAVDLKSENDLTV